MPNKNLLKRNSRTFSLLQKEKNDWVRVLHPVTVALRNGEFWRTMAKNCGYFVLRRSSTISKTKRSFDWFKSSRKNWESTSGIEYLPSTFCPLHHKGKKEGTEGRRGEKQKEQKAGEDLENKEILKHAHKLACGLQTNKSILIKQDILWNVCLYILNL